jgi:methionyl-tRNA formyltransferase
MRIAFFGLPLAALLLTRDGHDVVYAALCRPEAIGVRRLRRTIGAPRVDMRPDAKSAATFGRVRDARPDIVVSWFWTTKLPLRVVELARLGGFGVHPSLLPRHRGPDPYFWAIDTGDVVTGVTAHRLAAEYDTGAVLGSRTIAIEPEWNAWTLAKKLDRPSLALLRETARAFAEGRPPRAEAQDEARATAAPEPDDEMLEIRWAWPTASVLRRVRAAAPWPGAYTEIGDSTIAIVRARAAERFPRALAPGEAVVQEGLAVVRTADGAIELLEGREDDAALDASELARRVADQR